MYNISLEDIHNLVLTGSQRDFEQFCTITYPDHRQWPQSVLNYALFYINHILYRGEK